MGALPPYRSPRGSMTLRRTAGFLLVIEVLLSAASASAQTPRDFDSRHGAALALFAGGTSGSSGTGAALGWSIGWIAHPRVTLEGSGWWTDEPSVEGFAALFGPRVNLVSPRRVIPFVSGEAGIFRSIIDATKEDVPAFYLDRMPEGPLHRTFDDLALAVGGGVDIYLERHVSLRPHARLVLVTADSQVRPLAVYGVHVTYHFAEDPFDPDRR